MMRVQFSLGSLALVIRSCVHLSFLIMSRAYEALTKLYSLNDFKDIAEYGCDSGVATHHIYYRDTIKFFDEHEDEIMMMLEDVMGSEYPGQLLTRCDNSLTSFKNDAVWTYIELTANHLVDEDTMMNEMEVVA